MQELPDDQLAAELKAIHEALEASAADPESESGMDETPAEPGEEDAIRARLRQIRQDSAHIPAADEAPPSLLGRIKGMFGRKA